MKFLRNIILVSICVFSLTAYQNCAFMEDGFAPNSSLSNETGSRVNPTPFPRNDDPLRIYFNNNIVPVLESNCVECHTPPRNGGIAPLTIYSYDSMQPKLASGLSPQNNFLINKMRDIIAHDGGNRCNVSGIAQTPCKEIVDWWVFEFGDGSGSGGPSSGLPTAVTSITATGRIRGYASDIDDGAREIDMTFYIDGPPGVGVDAGTVTANLTGPLGDKFQGHYFDYTLPDQFRDGSDITLYVYADGTAAADQVGLEVDLNVYAPGQAGDAGFDYYENTLRPALVNSCGNCHSPTYLAHFETLLSPLTPAKGGTALDNKLINKAAGMDSHGGGTICGNKNGNPCAQIQEWWNREFGP